MRPSLLHVVSLQRVERKKIISDTIHLVRFSRPEFSPRRAAAGPRIAPDLEDHLLHLPRPPGHPSPTLADYHNAWKNIIIFTIDTRGCTRRVRQWHDQREYHSQVCQGPPFPPGEGKQPEEGERDDPFTNHSIARGAAEHERARALRDYIIIITRAARGKTLKYNRIVTFEYIKNM